eukprot:gene31183-6327_t
MSPCMQFTHQFGLKPGTLSKRKFQRVQAARVSSENSAPYFNNAGNQPQLQQLPWNIVPRLPMTQAEERQLTGIIMHSQSWQHLQSIHLQHGEQMNPIHIAAMITHLSKMESSSSHDRYAGNQGGSDLGPSTSYDRYSGNNYGGSDLGPSTSYGSSQPTRRAGASERSDSKSNNSNGRHEVLRSKLSPGAAHLMHSLLAEVEYGMRKFGPRQLANIFWAVAKCGHQPSPEWMARMIAATESRWEEFEPQHLANIAYGMALMGVVPTKGWLLQLLQANIPFGMALMGVVPTKGWLLQLLQVSRKKFAAFKPQELSNLLYAVARLTGRRGVEKRWLTEILAHLEVRMPEFNSQELSNVLWALWKLQHTVSGSHQHLQLFPSTVAFVGDNAKAPGSFEVAGIHQQQGSHQQEHSSNGNGEPEASHAASGRAAPSHHNVQGEAAVAAVASRGSQQSQPNLDSMKSKTRDVRIRLVEQRLLRQPHLKSLDTGWVTAFLTASRRRMSEFQPVGLTMMLVTLGKLKVNPGEEWLNAMVAVAEPRLRNMRPQTLATMLLGFAYVDRWMETCAQSAAAQFCYFSNADITCYLWALGKLRWKPSASVMGVLLYQITRRMSSMSNAEVLASISGLTQLQLNPGKAWVSRCCVEVYNRMGSMTSAELGNLGCGLSKLGCRPGEAWMHMYEASSLAALGEFTRRGLAMLLYAMGVMAYRPSREWLAAYLKASSKNMRDLNKTDVTSMLWALAVLDISPGAVWLESFVAAALPHLHKLEPALSAKTLWAVQRIAKLPYAHNMVDPILGRLLQDAPASRLGESGKEAAASPSGAAPAVEAPGNSDALLGPMMQWTVHNE